MSWKGDDGFFRRAVVPRGERVGGSGNGCGERQRADKRGGEEVLCAGGLHGFFVGLSEGKAETDRARRSVAGFMDSGWI